MEQGIRRNGVPQLTDRRPACAQAQPGVVFRAVTRQGGG
jgi:hypothetical protein